MALDNIKNYVKFVKGSVDAWNLISESDRKADTLYFITEYEKDQGGSYVLDEKGQKKPLNTSLYLGNVLVSDGKETSILPEDLNLKLDHLIDVDTDYALNDKMVLAYSISEEKWIPQSIDTITTDIGNFEGATETAGGAAGLVPAPGAGNQKSVLTGDGEWTSVDALDISSINTLEEQITTLVGDDSNKSIRDIAAEEAKKIDVPDISTIQAQVNTLVGTDTDKSVRAIAAEELAAQLIPENAEESLNELKEIAAWIQEHPSDASEMNLSIQALEEEVYIEVPAEDEDGNPIITKVSKIDNLETALNEAKNNISINSNLVGSLNNLLGADIDEDGTIKSLSAVDKINLIANELDPEYDDNNNIISFKKIEQLNDLMTTLEVEFDETGSISSLNSINRIEEALGIERNEESGEIIITSAPIGKLEDLLLVKNAENEDEAPQNLVEAINVLTEQMTWKDLDVEQNN